MSWHIKLYQENDERPYTSGEGPVVIAVLLREKRTVHLAHGDSERDVIDDCVFEARATMAVERYQRHKQRLRASSATSS